MRKKLPELQDNHKKTKRLRSKGLLKSWEDIEKVFYYQSHPYVLKVICSEQINKHHDNSFEGRFGIKKIRELIARKYY